MTLRMRFIGPLVVFLVIVLFFWKGLGKDPNLLPSLLVNKPVPNFSSPSLDDLHEVINSRQFKGKITILNVWASWCESCQIEHPLLIDLVQKNQIQLFGLNYKDQQENALSYLIKRGNPYHKIIYDPQGKLAMQFGVYGTPETFLIDKRGIVRYRYVGPLTVEILDNDLLPRIKKIQQEEE
ncbi:MAG: DsbE family thiol:disulfide interchange protein [Gammaproteobacteria bacterium]|nr:DsbE family thiol:disulfide interchange protein [Gammaproteobacteria bacterium]